MGGRNVTPPGQHTTCVKGLEAQVGRPPFLLARALGHNRRLLPLTFRRKKQKNFFFGLWMELYQHRFELVVRALVVGPMDVLNWWRRWRDIFYLFLYFYLEKDEVEQGVFLDRTVETKARPGARLPWLYFFGPVTNRTD